MSPARRIVVFYGPIAKGHLGRPVQVVIRIGKFQPRSLFFINHPVQGMDQARVVRVLFTQVFCLEQIVVEVIGIAVLNGSI